MNRCTLQVLAVLVPLAGTVHGEVTVEILGDGQVTDMSADGTVVVGNLDSSWETFWWSEETGVIPLGRPSSEVGPISGTPDVSDDGTFVSATIADPTVTFVTEGRWNLTNGWQDLMPPTPPDGGLLDNAYGSAWGLSGDGSTVVGLYWRPGQSDGSAHACAWTEATGVVDLGSSGGNSRANAANYDGSVIVGWDETPFGTWQPTVWVDGVLTRLGSYDASCEATAVSADGLTVYGFALDDPNDTLVAARWLWNGSSWDEDQLGALPGTGPINSFGASMVTDASADGSIIVGYNRFGGPGNASGFIWTEEDGMIDVEDYLADNGLTIGEGLDIQALQAISDDGTKMVGIAQQTVFPFGFVSFMITTNTEPPEPSVPAVSEWGLVVVALLLLTAGTVVIRRRSSFAY